jgi:mannan endo-1,4-beta-mannosidase
MEAKRLMERLAEGYGKRTLSGTYGQAEDDFLAQATGRRASILGGDFMDYSPSRTERGADPKGHTEEMIAAAKKGKIITMSWHWNAPKGLLDSKTKDAQGRTVDRSWYQGFYTEATTFDLKAALADPSGEDYRLLIRDIDVISRELKKFQAANVPVLWRPLHEAEGGWFWWGAKGPEPCKKLWRILHERMVRHHQLNNLIWVWNSESEDWYPGDDTVDIVAVDRYPEDRRDPLAGAFVRLLERFDGKKILAVAEFPGMMDAARMFRFGARWAYFVSWKGDLGPRGTDPAILKQTMGDRRVDSLPK